MPHFQNVMTISLSINLRVSRVQNVWSALQIEIVQEISHSVIKLRVPVPQIARGMCWIHVPTWVPLITAHAMHVILKNRDACLPVRP